MSLEHLNVPGGTEIGPGARIYAVHCLGQIVGLIEEHAGPDGGRCDGYLKLRGREPNPDARPSWVVEQEEPLTLSPSVLCRTCGNHGFVRDGKWVPA